MVWMFAALAAPLTGVERLEPGPQGDTCAWLADSPTPWCWSGWGEAVPRDDLRASTPLVRLDKVQLDWPSTPVQVQALYTSVCVLDEAQEVWCQGDQWRSRFGMPTDTPADRPVHVKELDGAEKLDRNMCILRKREVICPTPTGAETRLTNVEDLYAGGEALLADHTLWSASYPHEPLAEGIAAVSAFGHLRQTLDGRVLDGRDRAELPEVVGGSPASLVGSANRGCVLAVGGQVTCWGGNLEGALPGEGELRLFWGPHGGLGRVPPAPCSVRDRVLTCSESVTGSPTHARTRVENVDKMIGYDDLVCALQGSRLSCFGEPLTQGTLFWGDLVLDGVLDAALPRYILFVLTEEGQIKGYLSDVWADLGPPVPGATALGVGTELACAATATALHCHDGERSAVIERPPGPVPADLCYGTRCLRTEPPPEQLKRPWTVQRGAR